MCAMARAVALGWMLSPTAVYAGTITSFSTVTIPSDFGTATKLGPQSMQISFSNQINASRPLNLQLILTGATFVTSTVPTLSLSVTATPSASAICTVSSFQDKQLIQCTPMGGTTITGVTVSDLTYTNATALTATGGSIKVSGTLSAPSIGTFEEIASKEVVVRPQSGGGSVIGGNTLRQGAVYSSAQTSAQSLFRVYNGGGVAGTVTITLADYTSGQILTTWTSPSIAPGAAPQFPISTI